MPATATATPASEKRSSRERELERENVALRARVAELEVELAKALRRIEELEAERAAALERNTELEARLKESSRTSHRPPSSDPPWSKPPQRKREPTGRKRGAQPGHEGAARELVPVAQVDKVVPLFPTGCRGCGAELPPKATAEGASPQRHQVVEIPPGKPQITEYQLHATTCSCGEVTCAELPPEVRGVFGPGLQARVALLTGRYRLSRREAVDALKDLFGVEISLGSILALEQQTSAALEAPYEEALAAVREADVVHADETGWRKANLRAWLWIVSTASLAVFWIDPRRNREAFVRILGAFDGILITDRWAAYVRHPKRRHQLCWAHLRRDFERLLLRGGAAARLGKAMLVEIKAIFELWHLFTAGKISRATLRRRTAPIKSRVHVLLEEGTRNSHKKARGLCAKLLPVRTCLWVFLRVPGVEPTNNNGERDLRKAVLWRKGSFGCQSAGGCLYVSRILTVAASLRKQGRDVLGFLEAAVRAHRQGLPAPSLLAG